MKKLTLFVTGILIVLMSFGIQAHEGHGEGFTHELHHSLLLSLAIISLGVGLIWLFNSRQD